MTLLVRDEADILETNLDYHRAQGVDFVVCMDNRSTDATPEILRSYERQGFITDLIEERGDDYDQGPWVTRMARVAASHGADWVINNDADEFWWPRTGDLKATLATVPPEVGALRVARHNFLPSPDTREPFSERMIVRSRVSTNALGRPLPPKIAHRGSETVVVHDGNHRISDPALGTTVAKDTIEILHFPMRTYRQFEHSIVTIGRAYSSNRRVPPRIGGAQRHLYRLWAAGRLEDHYRSAQLQGQDPDAAVEDVRLRDFLRRLRAPRPRG